MRKWFCANEKTPIDSRVRKSDPLDILFIFSSFFLFPLYSIILTSHYLFSYIYLCSIICSWFTHGPLSEWSNPLLFTYPLHLFYQKLPTLLFYSSNSLQLLNWSISSWIIFVFPKLSSFDCFNFINWNSLLVIFFVYYHTMFFISLFLLISSFMGIVAVAH